VTVDPDEPSTTEGTEFCENRPIESYGLTIHKEERLITHLQWLIRHAVRVLALLMTLVIFWGVADVLWLFYTELMAPPILLLNISDILELFGAFMAVLIAIEIFINIIMYLRDDVIHVKLVMATALMATARKIIVFDYTKISSEYVFAAAAVMLALSIGYWLVSSKRS
jgi:uncharacterized membrane protein (DUF373 family)